MIYTITRKRLFRFILSGIAILLVTYGIAYELFYHNISETVSFLTFTMFIFAINVLLIFLSKNIAFYDRDFEIITQIANYRYYQNFIVVISLLCCYVVNVASGLSDSSYAVNPFGIIIACNFAQGINYYLRKKNKRSVKIAIASTLSILLLLSLSITVYSLMYI